MRLWKDVIFQGVSLAIDFGCRGALNHIRSLKLMNTLCDGTVWSCVENILMPIILPVQSQKVSMSVRVHGVEMPNLLQLPDE
mgnify:CR=1 FL=1